ncbi:unnamed protein product [Gadus morhua 'NCC']
MEMIQSQSALKQTYPSIMNHGVVRLVNNPRDHTIEIPPLGKTPALLPLCSAHTEGRSKRINTKSMANSAGEVGSRAVRGRLTSLLG